MAFRLVGEALNDASFTEASERALGALLRWHSLAETLALSVRLADGTMVSETKDPAPVSTILTAALLPDPGVKASPERLELIRVSFPLESLE